MIVFYYGMPNNVLLSFITVAQKLNQGTIRQKGCNLLSGSFFGYFFGQAKKWHNKSLTLGPSPIEREAKL